MRKARGLARIVVGGGSLVAVSVVWVSVGTGVHGLAAADAQRAADAAALAGAGALLRSPADPAPARAEAIRFARSNRVLGRIPDPQPGDIEVDIHSGTVRARVHVTVYSIPNALAWILGVGEVSVSADATGEVCAGSPSAPCGEITRTLKLIE